MGEVLRDLLVRLEAGRGNDYSSCDVSSSSVHPVSAPVQRDLYLELQSLAMVFNRDVQCLAGDLLNAAIQDLLIGLDDDLDELAQQAKQAIMEAGRPEKAPGVEFNVGGT